MFCDRLLEAWAWVSSYREMVAVVALLIDLTLLDYLQSSLKRSSYLLVSYWILFEKSVLREREIWGTLHWFYIHHMVV
jgi:hypothetical protein